MDFSLKYLKSKYLSQKVMDCPWNGGLSRHISERLINFVSYDFPSLGFAVILIFPSVLPLYSVRIH